MTGDKSVQSPTAQANQPAQAQSASEEKQPAFANIGFKISDATRDILLEHRAGKEKYIDKYLKRFNDIKPAIKGPETISGGVSRYQ